MRFRKFKTEKSIKPLKKVENKPVKNSFLMEILIKNLLIKLESYFFETNTVKLSWIKISRTNFEFFFHIFMIAEPNELFALKSIESNGFFGN